MKHKNKGQNTMIFCPLLYIISVQKNRQGGQKVGWFYSKKLLLDKK